MPNEQWPQLVLNDQMKQQINDVLVLPLVQRLPKLCDAVTRLGGTPEIMRNWIWATFNGIPSVETRRILKAMKFRWNPARRLWQYAGVYRRHSNRSNDELRRFYGALGATLRNRTNNNVTSTQPTFAPESVLTGEEN